MEMLGATMAAMTVRKYDGDGAAPSTRRAAAVTAAAAAEGQ